jgi:hypothetical protein
MTIQFHGTPTRAVYKCEGTFLISSLYLNTDPRENFHISNFRNLTKALFIWAKKKVPYTFVKPL